MLVVVSFFDAALSSYNTAQFFIVSILLWRNGCYWYLYKRSVFILEWFWGLNCLHRYILKSEIWFEIWLITFGNANCCQLWRFASVSGDISSGDWTVCWLTFFFFFNWAGFYERGWAANTTGYTTQRSDQENHSPSELAQDGFGKETLSPNTASSHCFTGISEKC